jgi:hypothetical protein
MRAIEILPSKNAQFLTVASLLAAAGMLIAQEPEPVLDRPTLLSDPTPMLPMTPAPTLDSITLFPDAAENISLEKAIDKHPWKFVLHGSVTSTYDDNIFISHENRQADYIFTIAPGVAVGRGDFKNELSDLSSYENRFNPDRSEILAASNYIFLHYIPSVTLFTDHSSEDSADHDVTLEGQYEWKRLTLGIKARFQTMNLPDVDLGERVERHLFSGVLSSKYDYTDKTSFEANFYNYIRDYAGNHVDSVEYRSQEWMNYQVAPKITMSVGFTYGHVDLSDGPGQDYEQALVRARYRATEKVQFDISGGVEFRNVHGFGSRANGIFSLGVSYLPFDGTSIFLQAYRRTVTSATASGVTYTVTGVEGQIRQRFARRYYFVLAAGYQNSVYENLVANAAARTDDIFYIHPSVGIDVTKWLSCELGFEYREDNSTVANRTFSEITAYFQVNVFF